MTLSYYYADPDGNHVEMQVDCFGDWAKSKAWMRARRSSRPIRSACSSTPTKSRPTMLAGMSFDEIHAKAMAGGYTPEQAPVEIPEVS